MQGNSAVLVTLIDRTSAAARERKVIQFETRISIRPNVESSVLSPCSTATGAGRLFIALLAPC